MTDSFTGLDARTREWLRYEQTVNERIVNTRMMAPIDHRSNTVKAQYRPEARPAWEQEVVWLPAARARCYGAVEQGVAEAFGVGLRRRRRSPLFLHPQRPASHQGLVREFTSSTIDHVRATPTSSVRSVLAWRLDGARPPVILKLSIGAVMGRHRRTLRERQVARAVVISSLFETIPVAHRRELGLSWFAEPAGVAETTTQTGWILRRLPAFEGPALRGPLIPAFAAISRQGHDVPLLVQQIRRSGTRAERFVIERVLRPYVRALAYLLFEEGIQYEGHTQNVLLEIDADRQLTGRLALRDLSDTTVNIAYRCARRRPLPRLGSRTSPPPFELSANAADFTANWNRPRVYRGYDTVDRYGLAGFVWPLNRSLRRYVRRYDWRAVDEAYLELWQEAAMFYMNVEPLRRRSAPKGIATDESVAYYLRHTDWKRLGAVPASVPASAHALRVEGYVRRRSGRVYDRVETDWGDIYLQSGLPVFFRAAY